eukprot:2354056-Rhodomonas_salina.2
MRTSSFVSFFICCEKDGQKCVREQHTRHEARDTGGNVAEPAEAEDQDRSSDPRHRSREPPQFPASAKDGVTPGQENGCA